MVGSAIVRKLKNYSCYEIITRSREDLDLINQNDVNAFFASEKPQEVYLAAAKVGGIFANNTYPADFIYNNLMIQANIINAAFQSRVKKLLFLGSSCIYPKFAKQPMNEKTLLTGTLEPTNEPYAIAKIAGIKLCESYNRQYRVSHGIDYRSVMPTNLYGPGDNYHSENSHVIPALIRRFHEAKMNNVNSISIWGSGTPKREFLYVDDMASASVFIMNLDDKTYNNQTHNMLSHINVGYGEDITIKQLGQAIAKTVDYKGKIIFDTSKPDGSPRKLMDSQLIFKLGWRPSTNLQDGLQRTYLDFKNKLTFIS